MTDKEIINDLLWEVVQQAVVLRQVEAAMKLLHPIEGDVCMHEARYQRTIKDCGLVQRAKEIESEL